MTTSNLGFSSYLRIISRRWWLIILLPVVTSVVIFALASSAEPEYQAFVRLQILPVDPQEVSLFSQTRYITADEQVQAVHDDFFDVLRTPAVAWKTIADLNLGGSLSADDLIERINSNHATDFITVSAQMSDPELAQQVVTRHVENALDTYRSITSNPSQISLDFIEDQLADQVLILAERQEALQNFQLENELGDLNREIAAYQDLRRTLRSERDLALLEARRNERLATAYGSLSDDNMQRAETLRASSTISTTSDLDETIVDRPLAAEIDNLLTLGRSQRRTAEEHIALATGYRASAEEYERILDERQQELIYLLALQEENELLTNAVTEAQGTYLFLTDKANEARLKLSQGQNIGYLQVTDPARLPDAAVPRPVVQLLLVGIVISLLLAVILAFVLEVIENSLTRTTASPSTTSYR